MAILTISTQQISRIPYIIYEMMIIHFVYLQQPQNADAKRDAKQQENIYILTIYIYIRYFRTI